MNKIRFILSRNNDIQLPENFSLDSVVNMKYVSLLISVDIERLFRFYEHILNGRKINMTYQHDTIKNGKIYNYQLIL